MLTSKWLINRIGLVDFWYYDEEEFYFKDGRLLLRGANGSGKSVTMQSFIPLLLDGNKASERLDPFGTKARRLENYLLEDGDGREERTGYLYMEFKRQNSDTYTTIGIGLNAKRGKKMDSWYFCITDGRRIGKEFLLYKDMKEKIALSRLELTNRLGQGGLVVNGQKEYMKLVNDTLFGYESVDEYKELIDLLIQLRTPKLSKDFKPTVLNEILSNSLPPLSDEDLRPMSEAIENMDNLKARMDSLDRSLKAANKIYEVYQQYNCAMLGMKANWFIRAQEQFERLKKQELQLDEIMTSDVRKQKEEIEREQDLIQEQKSLELKRDSLAENDVNKLAKKKVELENEKSTISVDLKEKKKLLETHEQKERDVNRSIHESKDMEDSIEQEISSLLEAMKNCFEVLEFDENTFLCDELSNSMKEDYSFQIIKEQVKQKKQMLEEGIDCLSRFQLLKNEYEKIQVDLEKLNQEMQNLEITREQYEEQARQVKSEWQEHFYQWARENEQLIVSPNTEQRVVQCVLEFDVNTDFSTMKELIRSEKEEREKILLSNEATLIHDKKLLIEELEAKKRELEEWENKKDPQPKRTEEVQKNRSWLIEQKIPHYAFYQVVDFVENISLKQRNNLEEALSKMGILDAVVVPSNYQSQVLSMREGMCDQYIFAEVSYVKENMERLLEISQDTEDIIFYQELNQILSSMSIMDEGTTWVNERGVYGLGAVKGTITGEYQAKFIGVRARQEYRKKKIEELMTEVMKAQEAVKTKEDELTKVLSQKEQIESEYQQFPKIEDVRLAVNELDQLERKISYQQKIVAEKESDRKKCYVEVKELGVQAAEHSRKLYLKAELSIFQNAKKEMEEYQDILFQLENCHQRYLHQIKLTAMGEEQLNSILDILDGIRYDLGSIDRKQTSIQQELFNIDEQLKLLGFDEIQTELLSCTKRLDKIPEELKECYTNQSAAFKDLENHRKQFAEIQEKLKYAVDEVAVTEQGFTAECGLNYVEEAKQLEHESTVAFAKRIYKLFSMNQSVTVSELSSSFQERFFKNNSELADFYVSQRKIFQQSEYKDINQEDKGYQFQRIDVTAKYKGREVSFLVLCQGLKEDVEVQKQLVKESDRSLFQDILANTISKKIRYKIYNSEKWVDRMNELMNTMNTSSGLKLSLVWKKKKAEEENQMNTKELVDLLKKDAGLMTEEELDQLSKHFQSKLEEARRMLDDIGNVKSFHAIMREILDYRKWFEFQLYFEKTGEKRKELTNNAFFTFSGGEKAMSMYVPLFSAVVAKYQGAKEDAPRLVSLDEAFAGVDEQNISDMFRLMVELDFEFIINSQILWGDCDTVPNLAIYQLLRKENAKYVTVIPYLWNGKKRVLVTDNQKMDA